METGLLPESLRDDPQRPHTQIKMHLVCVVCDGSADADVAAERYYGNPVCCDECWEVLSSRYDV